MRSVKILVAIFIIAGNINISLAQNNDTPPDAPEGYVQIIPRGRIAAINNPVYVSAEEAEIKGKTWILGVVIDGQARAYSLNTLNSHEIVNDRIGDVHFAAVW